MHLWNNKFVFWGHTIYRFQEYIHWFHFFVLLFQFKACCECLLPSKMYAYNQMIKRFSEDSDIEEGRISKEKSLMVIQHEQWIKKHHSECLSWSWLAVWCFPLWYKYWVIDAASVFMHKQDHFHKLKTSPAEVTSVTCSVCIRDGVRTK